MVASMLEILRLELPDIDLKTPNQLAVESVWGENSITRNKPSLREIPKDLLQ